MTGVIILLGITIAGLTIQNFRLNSKLDKKEIALIKAEQRVKEFEKAFEEEKKAFNAIANKFAQCQEDAISTEDSYAELISTLKGRNKYISSIKNALIETLKKEKLKEVICDEEGKKVTKIYECPSAEDFARSWDKMIGDFNDKE